MPFETNRNEVYLSLIIPAFNEESRIMQSLDHILAFLQAAPYSSEIIVVDDGSQDRTVEAVRNRFSQRPEVRIHQQPRNLGKGGAVKQGMLMANGKYLFFSDADLSVPIETIRTFLIHLENDCDVAVGSRQLPSSRIEIRQPFYRSLLGKVYTRLSNWILGLGVSDFTCGFKGFRMESAKDIFPKQRLHNWSFDAEILYLARLKGYRIQEIPVTWRNEPATKVRLWRDGLTSFGGLLQIRFYDHQGRYR